MFCAIYRSVLRDQTYLFIERKDDFSRVPDDLLKGFGKPRLAMMFNLNGSKPLANADIHNVKAALEEKGYYLQIPPSLESLLHQHLSKQTAVE